MNVGCEKWLVPPYLRKSGPLSRYLLIAVRSSSGVMSLSSSPAPWEMASFICSWKSVSFIRREAEGDGIGSTPSDDVARGLNARADFFAARDPIANAGERDEHAVTIADRGDAVFELDLRGFEIDVFLAGVVADEGLVAFFHAAVEG